MDPKHLAPLTERPMISADVFDVNDALNPTEVFPGYVAEHDPDPEWIHVRFDHSPDVTMECEWRKMYRDNR